jgi:hypothetical protein
MSATGAAKGDDWIGYHVREDYEPSALRARGYRIYAPDQTAFARMRGGSYLALLTPFRAAGHTWMLARPSPVAALRLYPSNIVLRPRPDGQMNEVCVYRSVSLI